MTNAVKHDTQMPSQSAAFRRTVAERMAAYQDRIARRIRNERKRHGEEPIDVAYAIGVDKRTVERWEAAEVEPQLRNVKALAQHWELEVADLQPDLEKEEQQLRAQLDRIEEEQRQQRKILEEIRERLPAKGDEPGEEGGPALPAEPPIPPSPRPTGPAEPEPESDEEEPKRRAE